MWLVRRPEKAVINNDNKIFIIAKNTILYCLYLVPISESRCANSIAPWDSRRPETSTFILVSSNFNIFNQNPIHPRESLQKKNSHRDLIPVSGPNSNGSRILSNPSSSPRSILKSSISHCISIARVGNWNIDFIGICIYHGLQHIKHMRQIVLKWKNRSDWYK